MATEPCNQAFGVKKRVHELYVLAVIAPIPCALWIDAFAIHTGCQMRVYSLCFLIFQHCMGWDMVECQGRDGLPVLLLELGVGFHEPVHDLKGVKYVFFSNEAQSMF